MCVIAFAPKGVESPTETDIRNMFSHNPDGAGFAYTDKKGKVHYRKGFMSINEFLEAVKPLEQWTNCNFAMHFRIGTAGKNDAKTCHPYPLSSNFGETRKLEGEGPVLFHNGVMSAYGGMADPLANDTQDFVIGIASKLIAKPTGSKIVKETIAELTKGSRILTMYDKNKYLMWGTWQQENGIWYSNMLWKPATYSNYYGYYGGYSSYYDDEDEQTRVVTRGKIPFPKTDMWGCYNYKYATPDGLHDWIYTDSEQWGEHIKGMAQETSQKGIYKFFMTKDQLWECSEDYKEWWTVDSGKTKRYAMYDELDAMAADYDGYTQYFEFSNYDKMNKFLSSVDDMGEDDMGPWVEKKGIRWYYDDIDIAMWTYDRVTEEQLKELA